MESAESREAFERVKSLFRQDFLPEAYLALQDFEARFPGHSTDAEEVAELRRDVAYANECLQMLADFDAWDLVREEDDIAIFSKGSKNEFFIRSEMIMPYSALSLLAIFSEIDLLSTWIDVIAQSREVARPSLFRKVNHYVMKLPWPLSNRDVLVCCTGVPMPQNHSVLLIMQDARGRSTYLGYDLPPPEQGIVRVLIHQCCINLMQLAPDRTQVSFLVRSDPCIALFPASVRNWGSKQAIFAFMRAIREQCARFPGSEFERRMEKNPEFYNTIKARASKYFEESAGQL